jgi:soluble lytic murein transglycosylase-like protein
MRRALAKLILLISFGLVATIVVAAEPLPRQAMDPGLRDILLSAINASDGYEDRSTAEVWFIDMSNRLRKRMPDDRKRMEFLHLLYRESMRAGLPPELVLAVIDVESNFNSKAISSAGARGLMQVMPFWVKEIGRPGDNLHHAPTNLRYGCTILSYYLSLEKGDLADALGRYNGSLGSYEYVTKVLNSLEIKWYRQ